MILYFLRHAHAEDGYDKPDELRALTATGHQQAAATGDLLKKAGLKLAALYSSPRLRATQTAEAIGNALGIAPQIREELNIGFNLTRLHRLVADANISDSIMVVGHEPTLSQTIREITGGRVEMKKCGLARIDVMVRQPLNGELVWLLPPRLVNGMIEDL
jgi:phosphohistidine phosphatase